MKVQIERFHLNGHTTGFRPQTQKLQLPFKTPLFTPAVKGLKTKELTIPTIFSHNITAKRDLELPRTLYTKYPATELSGRFFRQRNFYERRFDSSKCFTKLISYQYFPRDLSDPTQGCSWKRNPPQMHFFACFCRFVELFL